MEYPIRTTKQLGMYIKAYRKSLNLTQQELAERLNITQQAYSLLEAAPERASFERLFSLFTVLGADIVLKDKTTPEPSEW